MLSSLDCYCTHVRSVGSRGALDAPRVALRSVKCVKEDARCLAVANGAYGHEQINARKYTVLRSRVYI